MAVAMAVAMEVPRGDEGGIEGGARPHLPSATTGVPSKARSPRKAPGHMDRRETAEEANNRGQSQEGKMDGRSGRVRVAATHQAPRTLATDV